MLNTVSPPRMANASARGGVRAPADWAPSAAESTSRTSSGSVPTDQRNVYVIHREDEEG